MAKYMTIEVIESEIIETAKAYGIPYAKDNCFKQEDNILWLPKSQCNMEHVTYEMYKEERGEFEANTLWQDIYSWIDVPMWLARKHGYFEHCIFHA